MTKPAFSDDMPTDEPGVHPHLSTTLVMILLIGLLAVLLVWALRPAAYSGDGNSHPSVGLTMKDFRLEPLVGDTAPVTLASLRGDVVLINFWGTWCGPCMNEFPHLVEMNDRLKGDERFRFVPVSYGPGGGEVPVEQLEAVTKAYLAKLKTELDVYRDPRGSAKLSVVMSARLPGFSFPTTVLLDREGNIVGLWQGYAPGLETEMEAAIKALLKT